MKVNSDNPVLPKCHCCIEINKKLCISFYFELFKNSGLCITFFPPLLGCNGLPFN